MPKRPDYGDATPEDLALALMRFQRKPLDNSPESGERKDESGQKKENPGSDSVSEQS